eukprot:scaffold13688_cov157-Skeletonema_marinoi.AAC.6
MSHSYSLGHSYQTSTVPGPINERHTIEDAAVFRHKISPKKHSMQLCTTQAHKALLRHVDRAK